MKSIVALFALLCLTCPSLFAQGKIDLQANDTVRTVLEKNVGGMVELRMESGEKIAGKVEKVGDNLVHLSQLVGAEFYDAAINFEAIAVVVVRVKK
jgi:hypothetical protein